MTKGKVKTINIHGKEYVPVSERLRVAHNELKTISIITKVLYQEPVVIKATVMTPKGTFTGISAANPSKAIEKQNPYEVAETSAVGRALAFAGYEIEAGIASAEEIKKSSSDEPIKTYSDKPASEGQKKMIFAVAKQKGLDSEQAEEKIKSFFNIEHFNDLTLVQAKKAIDSLLKLPNIDSDQIQA